MSLNAATIEFLLTKGLTGEDLLEVARRSEMRSDPTATERKRRQRDRERMSRVTSRRDAPPYEDTSTPSSETEVSSEKGKGRANPFPKPEWAEQQVWADFLGNRKTRRLKNTATAYRGFLEDIERLTDDEWPPGRLLEHAARKGWGGIYDPRDKANGNGRGRQEHSLGKTGAALERVLADYRREDGPDIPFAGSA